MAEIGGFEFNPADIARLGLTLGGTAFAADKVGGTSVPNIPFIPFQQALGQVPEVGLRSGEARFNIGGPDQGLVTDPAVAQMRQEAVEGLQGFTPGGIGSIPRIRGLEQDISQLRSNRSPFVEARVAPTQEAQAERFGALSEELGRTGVRGSLREQQLNKFQTQASRGLADQRALAEQESLNAINQVRQIQLGEQGNLTAQQRNQVSQNQLGAEFAIQKANFGLDAAQQQFSQDFAGLELGTDLIKNIFDTAARISINSGIQSIQSGRAEDEADLRLTDIIGQGINEVLDTFSGGSTAAGGKTLAAGEVGKEALGAGVSNVLPSAAAAETGATLSGAELGFTGQASEGLFQVGADGLVQQLPSTAGGAATGAVTSAAAGTFMTGAEIGLSGAGAETLFAVGADGLIQQLPTAAAGSGLAPAGFTAALSSFAAPLAALGVIAFDLLNPTTNPGKDLTNRVDEFFDANPSLNSGDPQAVLDAAKASAGGELNQNELMGLLSRKTWIPREVIRADPSMAAAIDSMDPQTAYISGASQGQNTVLRYADESSRAFQGSRLGVLDNDINQLESGDPMSNLPGMLEERQDLVDQLGIDPGDQFISSSNQNALLI